MVPSLGNRHPRQIQPAEDGWSDLKVGLAILFGGLAIAAVSAAFIVAGTFDLGLPLEPVAYLSLAISAFILWVCFVIPMIRDGMGWAVTLMALG